VVRATEPGFAWWSASLPATNAPRPRSAACPRVLNEALSAFLGTLDRYTLADIALGRMPGE
jgi:Rrf2 family nitric oxide-sensitive transcriptional repressor